MSDKINIITSGCSFTQTLHGRIIDYNSDDGFLDALYNYEHYINYMYFFIQEMKKYHDKNYIIYNLAEQSSGNHVIKTRLQNFLQNNNLKDPIYATTQLSGILRGINDQNNFIDINYQKEQWIFDYDNSLFKNYEDIIEKQIDVYTEIHKIYNNLNIKNKIFFGWGVLSPNDLTNNIIYERLKNLNIDTYITNKHGNYCTDSPENKKYAGMTEFLLEQNLPISIYVNENDAHLNPYANFIFYKKWYRKYFVEWGILPEVYECDIDEQELIEVSNWQK